ncbi:MAG: sodium-dependent transporter [Rikenellaceae bacterium]
METGNNSRATLGRRLGAILVAAGGSVGLGNIWKFPYVLGESGGAAFLIIYIGCILLLGMPIMLGEMAMGREARKNVVGIYRHFDPRAKFLGFGNVLIAFLIMGFYLVVSGWTAEYFVSSVSGTLSKLSTVDDYTSLFNSFITSGSRPVIFTWVFIAANFFIITLGVDKGIEKASKILMPILFFILIALTVKSLTMPNSMEGVKFLFKPDFSKITTDVFYRAMGQAFFSLSVGLGAIMTYASYFDKKTKLLPTAISVTLLDTLVAIIAGLMIFPAVFSVGIEPTSGPSLVFITLPAVLNSMPMSVLWSSVLFLLLIIAALTSTLSLYEVVTLYVIEEWKVSRRKATLITSLGVGCLATLASLSLGACPSISVAGKSLFDGLDFLTSNVMLPLSGMGISIVAGWLVKREVLKRQLTDFGESKMRILNVVIFLLRYLCPILLGIVFLNCIGIL